MNCIYIFFGSKRGKFEEGRKFDERVLHFADREWRTRKGWRVGEGGGAEEEKVLDSVGFDLLKILMFSGTFSRKGNTSLCRGWRGMRRHDVKATAMYHDP